MNSFQSNFIWRLIRPWVSFLTPPKQKNPGKTAFLLFSFAKFVDYSGSTCAAAIIQSRMIFYSLCVIMSHTISMIIVCLAWPVPVEFMAMTVMQKCTQLHIILVTFMIKWYSVGGEFTVCLNFVWQWSRPSLRGWHSDRFMRNYNKDSHNRNMIDINSMSV